jgi:hypothetical protein
MSHQYWDDEDTIALIEWVSAESIAAFRAGHFADAAALHEGVIAVISLGQFAISSNTRVEKWLEFRLGLIRDQLRQHRLMGTAAEQRKITDSLTLLKKFFDHTSNECGNDDNIELPEPFSE